MDSSGTGIELDRISSLHDSILCHILSFLSTKQAVGTSILSSRWRYLWVYAPTLIFDDADLSQDWDRLTYDKQKELHVTFADFVNRVLHFSKLQPLQEFTLRCTSVNYLYVHIDILHSWIDETAQVLYSGCPVLERLRIERNGSWDCRPSLNVTVPSVKWLRFENYMYNYKLDADFLNAEEPNHLNVNAPSMEYLYLEDNISDDFTLTNLSSLLQADISVYKVGKTPGRFSRYLGNLYNLLSGIAHIRTLTLSLFYESTPSFPINWSDFSVPIFHKLTYLRFHANNGASGWNMLMHFLHSSPTLRVLSIVQEIQITSFYGKEFELKGIEYLLKHTKTLRKMKINCWPARMKQEVGLFEKLARFPKGSSYCKLQLA